MQKNNKLDSIKALRNQNEQQYIEIDMLEFFPSEEEIQRREQKENDRRAVAINAEFLAEIKYAEELRKRLGYLPLVY
jgi:hypothetical protein